MGDLDDNWFNQLNVQYEGKEQEPEEVQDIISQSLGNAVLPDLFDCKDAHLTTLQEVAKTYPYGRFLLKAVSSFSDRWAKFEDSDVLVSWSRCTSEDGGDTKISVDVDFKVFKFGVQPTLKLEIFAEPGRKILPSLSLVAIDMNRRARPVAELGNLQTHRGEPLTEFSSSNSSELAGRLRAKSSQL
jgi:hypothetical protein